MPRVSGRLFLLPAPLAVDGLSDIPPSAVDVLRRLRYFIVEKARTSRRYLRSMDYPGTMDEVVFVEIPEEQSEALLREQLDPVVGGQDAGLLSEAGMPGIADPGALYVRMAHRLGIEVIPVSGPSSLFLALMASGLDGQRFSFHGYLSQKKNELAKALRDLESRAIREDAPQLFIETPYRNHQIMEVASGSLQANTLFCVAAGLGSENGFVKTAMISEWKKRGWPEIHKIPAVFILR